MKKHLGTRIEEEEKVKFKRFADELRISESALLRLLVIAINKKPMILGEILKKMKVSHVGEIERVFEQKKKK
ncbi:hypothetical protein JW766_04545 [Candidatus Dojkabacteria bacterium]|nr:hypothetical protein [Candidatus Dojkabacteria bacterium]